MPHVRLIATGGTIASQEDHAGGPVNAGLAGDRLIASLHEPLGGITVDVEDFRAVGSYALDLSTVHALCGRIAAALADPAVAGVVVTHGTDTMEESAFLADILVASDKPVVFTGAQRHAGVPDTDGPRNIADALRVAACPDMRGAAIVFEGDIHPAREVSKTHTARTDTFRSAGLGKIGEVDRGAVHLYRQPRPRLHVAAPRLAEVELIAAGLGAAPGYLEYCAANGTPGVVIAAFGRGNLPQGWAAAVARLTARGGPVVIASRCPEGRTAPVYGKDSGGTTLAAAGAVFSGDLSAVKARLLLSALLGAGAGPEAIAAAFA
ncbi:asparaginase [Paenirhodobacter sp.]|uniref:asparaginase n=1 Tax=Paenirhodobacter sp. TaxID=1965326 RepID=UPI003B3DAC4B